ncbi:MAG: hypothetical protein ABIE07_08110 [Candidatus Zixiibacteriota bacterium]
MIKKRKPTVLKRTSKPPTKAQLKEMREKVKAIPKHKEVKPMAKKKEKTTEKKETKSRRSLTPEDIERMIEEWDHKTTDEWAKEFGVSYQTVLHMVRVIRKEDNKLCPPKPKKGRTRADIAKAGIALFRKKQGKK